MKGKLIIRAGYIMSGVMLGFGIDYLGNSNFKAGIIFLIIGFFTTLLFSIEDKTEICPSDGVEE